MSSILRKKQFMDMLYKYKDAFSLRDQTGTCPNIVVEKTLQINLHSLSDCIMLRQKTKKILDTEMKGLCYLGILTEGFSAYSSPVILISRKVTKERRAVTGFRHTFSVLGSSRCEVLSVLDLKDALHSLRLSVNSKRYYGILQYFGSASYLY